MIAEIIERVRMFGPGGRLTMTQIVIENPILNSAFFESTCRIRFDHI
jgi:hypothetical protein